MFLRRLPRINKCCRSRCSLTSMVMTSDLHLLLAFHGCRPACLWQRHSTRQCGWAWWAAPPRCDRCVLPLICTSSAVVTLQGQ